MHRISHGISHPSKEQVRAYIRRRERALQPPPPPAEIRRQLAWCRVDVSSVHATMYVTPASVAAQGWHFSVEINRLGALMAIAWLMRSGVPHRKN